MMSIVVVLLLIFLLLCTCGSCFDIFIEIGLFKAGLFAKIDSELL